ncbi:unnamed protein product [Discosporangium mesarthrocarpum]
MWAISLYQGSLTYDNFMRERWGVLQFLRPTQVELVPILGQNSGKLMDKAGYCSETGFPWVEVPQETLGAPVKVDVIPGCAAYMTIRMINFQPAGDHDLAVCKVMGVAGYPVEGNESGGGETEVLRTQYLREIGMI